jgi:hypothetical protein
MDDLPGPNLQLPAWLEAWSLYRCMWGRSSILNAERYRCLSPPFKYVASVDFCAVHIVSTFAFGCRDCECANLHTVDDCFPRYQCFPHPFCNVIQVLTTCRLSCNDECDSDIAERKRADARRRQQKCRARAAPVAHNFLPSSQRCCLVCGCIHSRLHLCPCVRCHTRHPVGSDCDVAAPVAHNCMPSSPRCCSVCGCIHYRLHTCPCVRCHARHAVGSDCDVAAPDVHQIPRSNRYCSACSCYHQSSTICLCVRCHTRHPDGTDCDVSIATVAMSMPCSNALPSGLCFTCGCQHHVDEECPCVICHAHHAADCPMSVIKSAGICHSCGHRHVANRLNQLCPCIRCHHRHPGADCPLPPSRSSIVPRSPLVNFRVRERALTSSVEMVAFHNCGQMCVVCPHCRARTFLHERLNCCSDGRVIIPDFNVVPAEMRDLILSSHVRSNFRIYNSVMALASVGHSNKSLVGGTFVLGGKAYHRMGSILPGNVSAVSVYRMI